MLGTARRRWTALAVVVAGVAFAVFAYFEWVKPPGDVSRGNKVEFDTPPAKPKPPQGSHFRWPMYGLDLQHTRFLPSPIRPPFKRLWRFDGLSTVEISPILIDGTLYLLNKHATLSAVSAKTGKLKWKKYLGSLSATTPTYWHGRLFVTTLSKDVYAVDAHKRGKVIWHRHLPSRSESSPIVVGNKVIFGSEDGTVYALGVDHGLTHWKAHALGAVKGSLAYWQGKVFYGTYGGQVTALRAKNGTVAWRATQNGLVLGRAGNFYATPTVAFGRVYIGNTDGRIYSFSARTGRLAWSKSTGNYVYAGAAAADTPHTPPTVYIGSYDHHLYALDARTGRVRWSFDGGERISGAATVVGSVVYFSTLLGNKTFGINIANGHKVFAFPRGDYNPVIADDEGNIYLTAVNIVFKLRARNVKAHPAKATPPPTPPPKPKPAKR